MQRPLLLDLFCKAGGASYGYWLAGFDVVGVDIEPQKHYPFTFIQADAMTFPLDGYDAIHASPPCQAYTEMRSVASANGKRYEHPDLIALVRKRIITLPHIIENVEGARQEMLHPTMLCGTMFAGLRVWRHRLFESNVSLKSPRRCNHKNSPSCISVRQQKREYIGIFSDRTYTSTSANGRIEIRKRPVYASVKSASAAMGINWMNARELGEAIPPAYTEWLGGQMLTVLGYDSDMLRRNHNRA